MLFWARLSIWLSVLGTVSAKCCGGPFYIRGYQLLCRDGTAVPPWECCGYGKCNIACCNCEKLPDGKGQCPVCRDHVETPVLPPKTVTAERTKTVSPRTTAWRSVDDIAGDIVNHLISKPDAEVHKLADTNRDGVLTLKEYLDYLQIKPTTNLSSTFIARFNYHDTNNDGVIQLHEMRRA